ncbi:DUF2268 domain-containing putative Zn-dependent protease [Phenylobacterium sp.]|jgi:hypothetical protein|uniref:DUF2268 domain-containing putative Zn-dependent protease n=1 Tax=Phenylobacterium sp. TaxID=1871053 RepID=UPI0012143428|nr:DUF2268 domain-containing putative Zn-dependent protease [Phenylobacterium sp.]THD70235.1 MAG: lytic murein transglycosylase [Phenylobacterium sp.]
MKPIRLGIIAGAFASAAICGGASAEAASPPKPVIIIADVARFYRLYDAAGGHPGAEQLQHEYIDPGSEGLHHLAKVRNVTGATIAAALETRPELYADAKRCMAVLPRVRQRVGAALSTLFQLYPEARVSPVTIVVGRGRPVAVGGPGGEGVQIGLEALCAVSWLNPDVEERFVHVIAHEYAHVQQSPALADDEHPTVLELSLIEGGAEFVAELTSGSVGYSQFKASTKGHEMEIERAFVADEDKTDLVNWFNNSTLEKPGDLGYWVGYRIARSYYQHAADKRRALREILRVTDPKAFLAKSGWSPGMRLDGASGRVLNIAHPPSRPSA